MKQTVKRTVAGFVPAAKSPGFRILMYHAVDGADPNDRLALRVAPEAFRAQMAWLQAEGYRVVPLRELLAEPDGGDGAARVAITFDDGYASQLAAADVLEAHGFSATFFLVPRFLDGNHGGADYWERWSYLGWGAARALADRGFEIGAHSATHPNELTRCDHAALEQETGGARASLEQGIGRAVISFSYPHGVYDAAVSRAVQGAGYRMACTSVPGTNRAPYVRFELRRTEITGADRLSDFQRKLQGRYDWLGPLRTWRAAHA